MTTTMTPVRPRPPRARYAIWIVPLVLAAIGLYLLGQSTRPPGTVDRLTIVNGTTVPLTVEVNGAHGSDWLPLGTVDPRHSSAFESVVDQGRTWRFRLTDGPDNLGVIRRSGAALKAADWRLVIASTPKPTTR